jgi:hypothetical protein
MGQSACTNCDVRILRYHLSAWIIGLVEDKYFKLIELCPRREFLIVRFQGYFSGRKWEFHSLPAIKRKKNKVIVKLSGK